jgi:hypothetical protein
MTPNTVFCGLLSTAFDEIGPVASHHETVPLYRLPAAYKHCGPVCLSVLSNLSMALGLPNAKTAVVSTIELRYPRSTRTVSLRQGARFCMIGLAFV